MRSVPIVIAAAVPTLLACGAATAPNTLPTMGSVAGSYSATLLTVREGAGPITDVLTQGGFINLNLNPDGSTTGRAFVPEGGENDEDFDVDLVGTWALADTTVTLDHPADTFLRDMPLAVGNDRLVGQATFRDATVTVEFGKQ